MTRTRVLLEYKLLLLLGFGALVVILAIESDLRLKSFVVVLERLFIVSFLGMYKSKIVQSNDNTWVKVANSFSLPLWTYDSKSRVLGLESIEYTIIHAHTCSYLTCKAS